MKRYLDLGCMIGVTGWVCDERRGLELQQCVKHLPLDRVLVETDAPFLTPRTLKGTIKADTPSVLSGRVHVKPRQGRNEPAYLSHIVEELARHMEVSTCDLAHASYQNTISFFNLQMHTESS